MLPDLRSKVGVDYIQLLWTPPVILPYKYVQKYHCTGPPLKTGATDIGAVATWSFVRELQPATSCSVTLIAIYNPATLDPGITVRATTDSGRVLPLADQVLNSRMIFVCYICMLSLFKESLRFPTVSFT